MKTKLYLLLAMISSFAISCKDEDVRYEIARPEDSMHLQVSAENIQLTQELSREDAVTFTWQESSRAGSGVKVNYYFKMDIADNDFATSIDKVKIPAGSNSISFSHKKLNALLKAWKVSTGESAVLEAEIIAEFEDANQYIKPELSVVRFNATGYEIQPYDIFVVGTAIGGMDAAKALKMTEEIPEEKYTWNGVMKQGDYKFIMSNTDLTPSYTQGATPGSVILNESAAGETLFTISKAGFYVLTLNIETMTLEALYPTTEYEDIWMIGAATPAGWNIMNSVKLEKEPDNQVAFFYDGWLNTGEMKFPLELREDWAIAALMPVEAGTSEKGDNRMERIEAGGHDYKWNISKAGNYRVTLNTYTMTIRFDEVNLPDDLPFKAVWMLGDATPGGWVQGSQPFSYDFDAEKGTFYWEGELKAGIFKCPTNINDDWLLTCFMPKVVKDGKAPLTMTDAKVVGPGGDDDQWEVQESEAGNYRIELNVIKNTIKFIKK
ncbi:SusF/SusE family outer membrane protein [Bacteroides nordii]|jgi:hypothetical protein|uniref:SusE domain-containing protein n=1 Tax=Bacteroides nordii TaxID=291645 RepID=UPI001CBE59E6|nr:SusF/SusE family outer membrane protein [Bacteroides nordii]UAK41352.1 SusF/SusE family outer membrane protein [Bacteroides nordii]